MACLFFLSFFSVPHIPFSISPWSLKDEFDNILENSSQQQIFCYF